ncbi:hypothetical protein EVAR_47651_1 [Eumeta japonica]|uniref:Uncharacterized protein n=1 Tax=Eumeta variegata TaxID=151549 RepID=A0A4C1XYG1_EUMVA|nr:hypothetical protein EVAR_47651_1 [Eumeta japonica]
MRVLQKALSESIRICCRFCRLATAAGRRTRPAAVAQNLATRLANSATLRALVKKSKKKPDVSKGAKSGAIRRHSGPTAHTSKRPIHYSTAPSLKLFRAETPP